MSLQDLILALLQHVPGCPKVKLAKLILFAERAFYNEYGVSLSGTYFIRQAMGPVPANYDAILHASEGILWSLRCEPIVIQSTQEQKLEHRFYPLSKVSLSADASRIVAEVVDRFGSQSGSALSLLSHNLPAWRYAEPGEPIFIQELVLDSDEQYFRMLDLVSELEDCSPEDALPAELSSLL